MVAGHRVHRPKLVPWDHCVDSRRLKTLCWTLVELDRGTKSKSSWVKARNPGSTSATLFTAFCPLLSLSSWFSVSVTPAGKHEAFSVWDCQRGYGWCGQHIVHCPWCVSWHEWACIGFIFWIVLLDWWRSSYWSLINICRQNSLKSNMPSRVQWRNSTICVLWNTWTCKRSIKMWNIWNDMLPFKTIKIYTNVCLYDLYIDGATENQPGAWKRAGEVLYFLATQNGRRNEHKSAHAVTLVSKVVLWCQGRHRRPMF